MGHVFWQTVLVGLPPELKANFFGEWSTYKYLKKWSTHMIHYLKEDLAKKASNGKEKRELEMRLLKVQL